MVSIEEKPMESILSNLNRFKTKSEAVEYLIEADSTGLFKPKLGLELAAPWGEEAVEKVLTGLKEIRMTGGIPYGDTNPDDKVIGVYEVVKILTKEEGYETFDPKMAGSGFTATENFVKNIPLLAESVDGVSPRDIDRDWQSRLKNSDRDLDIEGLDDDE